MTSAKRIHRAQHDKENPYYIAARDTAQDKCISYDALGMLNYILSKPDDWDIQPDDLRREKCEIKKVYSILKELIAATYVERIYHRDAKKRITMVEYVAHEKPLSQNLQVGKQQVGKGNRYTKVHKVHSTKVTKREKPTPSTTAPLHPLIALWATIRKIDAVNIGAPIFTNKDLATAKRMAKWDTPPTEDEIKNAITNSKALAYAFQWLEGDIPKLRLQNAPKPSTTPSNAPTDAQLEHDYMEMFGDKRKS